MLITASLGTVFEWYDFFLYGSLAVFFGALFFPSGNETAGFLASLATFGAGFAVRPFGALLFGGLGDRIGRKCCFMITMVMMGSSGTVVSMFGFNCKDAFAGIAPGTRRGELCTQNL